MLSATDYEITEAENGEQALSAVAKQRPDLILMDIHLPTPHDGPLTGFVARRQGGRVANAASAKLLGLRVPEQRLQLRLSQPMPKLDGRPGRKPVPTRQVLEAVLWILNTGAQWHMLPQC